MPIHIWTYSLLSVVAVSLISLVGIISLITGNDKLKPWLLPLVSFSAGALLGDVFIHILPEIAESGWTNSTGIWLLSGIIIFFILEKFIFWHHSHSEHNEAVHSYTYLSLISDGLHNFIDGMVIAAAYLTNPTLGLATTLAVIFHEIPQELGNFAILVHGGFSKTKALLYNFISALTAIGGALIVLLLFKNSEILLTPLLAISAASFIYIAMSDLIPQLQKEENKTTALTHLVWFIVGIVVMWALLLFE
jgi:zinc and cadmium transporter